MNCFTVLRIILFIFNTKKHKKKHYFTFKLPLYFVEEAINAILISLMVISKHYCLDFYFHTPDITVTTPFVNEEQDRKNPLKNYQLEVLINVVPY